MSSTTRLLWSATIFAGLAITGCQSDSPRNSGPNPGPSTPEVVKPIDKPAAMPGVSQPRQEVEFSIDSDASKIDKTPKDTTVEAIVAQKGPADGNLAGRVAPFETQAWRVKCTLKSVQITDDGSFALLMNGDKGGQTVVEVPSPARCASSPLAEQITAAREAIADRCHPTLLSRPLNIRATVTGVGFFGIGASSKATTAHVWPRLVPGIGIHFGK